jgi:alpha-N-arabinofuranosidase
MLCPVHAEEKLRILKGTIDVVLKRDRSIDEWNMSGCHTLRDALGISRLLNVFQRLSDFVKIGSYFPLIHFYGTRKRRHGGAPISAYKDTIVLEAGYHAFDLYVNHTGEVAVDTYVESETYNLEFKVRDGQDVSFKNIPYLDSSATTSKDGKTLYLAVVNAHRDKDMECLIELRGCSPQETGRVFELNAEDVNVSNDRDNKENVSVVEKQSIQIAQNFTYTFPAHSATVIQVSTA